MASDLRARKIVEQAKDDFQPQGNNTSAQTITLQRTSKKLKAQLFLSAAIFWFALLSWFLPYGGALESKEGFPWSSIVMFFGAVWYFMTKFLIWWNHD